MEIGLGIIVGDEIGIAGDPLDLVGRQVARDVGVAFSIISLCAAGSGT